MRKIYHSKGFIWCVYDHYKGAICSGVDGSLVAFPIKRMADDVRRIWNRVSPDKYKTIKVKIMPII